MLLYFDTVSVMVLKTNSHALFRTDLDFIVGVTTKKVLCVNLFFTFVKTNILGDLQ